MWEKDKELVRKVRECFAEVQTQLDGGEEIDLSSICVKETDALIKYTFKQMNYYRDNHPQAVSDKKARCWTPKVPYFQNF